MRSSSTVLDAPHVRRWQRLAFAGVAAVAMGWAGLTVALVNVTALPRPALALRMAPGNPVALAKLMDDRLSRGGRLPPAAEIRDVALKSLVGQQINQRGVRLLAFASEMAGNRREALRLVSLAQRQSRRDLRSRLWMIEYFAAIGDANGALAQYDLALRTSSRAPALLYPILASALADEALWPPFARYLADPPRWLPYFLAYAIREGKHPEAIARMLLRYPGTKIGAMQTVLLGRLVAGGEPDLAIRFYLQQPGGNLLTTRSVDFSARNTNPDQVPITWNVFPRADIDVSFVGAEVQQRKALLVRADAGASGTIARKVVALAPGDYVVSFQPETADRGDGHIGWQVLCVNTNTAFASNNGARRDRQFKVPRECGTQYFDLMVSNVGQEQALEIQLSDVSVRRSGAPSRATQN